MDYEQIATGIFARNGFFWFWDETGAHEVGPFLSAEFAEHGKEIYCELLSAETEVEAKNLESELREYVFEYNE